MPGALEATSLDELVASPSPLGRMWRISGLDYRQLRWNRCRLTGLLERSGRFKNVQRRRALGRTQ
jgi:hypothetical protein